MSEQRETTDPAIRAALRDPKARHLVIGAAMMRHERESKPMSGRPKTLADYIDDYERAKSAHLADPNNGAKWHAVGKATITLNCRLRTLTNSEAVHRGVRYVRGLICVHSSPLPPDASLVTWDADGKVVIAEPSR